MITQQAAGLAWLIEPGTDDILGPEHEAGITEQVLNLLPAPPPGGWSFPERGGVLLDIGAHVGHYTLRAAKAGHRVIAVEGNPDTAGRLLANTVLNNLDGSVRIIPHPAWDQNESLTWKSYHEGTMSIRNGSGRIYPDPAGALWPVVLDDVLGTEPRIDVVKIDTEGAELHVLRGLRSTLKRCHPVMWIEDHAWTAAYTRDELFSMLDELNYAHELGGEWSGLTYWYCEQV